MLARANRIVRADDYRNTVRRGRKSVTAHCVVYRRPAQDAESPLRFGFIVSKQVGNAVTRNTIRRRLKGVAHEILTDAAERGFSPERTDIVIRALPGTIGVPWSTLLEEISTVVNEGVTA